MNCPRVLLRRAIVNAGVATTSAHLVPSVAAAKKTPSTRLISVMTKLPPATARLCAGLLFASLPLATFAQPIQDASWIGAGTSIATRNWTTASNWSTGAVPSANTNITFISANGATLANTNLGGGSTVIEVRSLTFNNHTGQLITDGTSGFHRVIGGSAVTDVGTGGELRFSTGDVAIITLSNAANISFNANASASMTLNLNYAGSATIDIGAGSTLGFNANGSRLVGTGGLIKEGAGTLRLGFNGSATLASTANYSGGMELRNGTIEFTFSGNTGNNPFGTGPLTLSGGTLTSSSTGSRTIYNPIRLNGDVNLGTVVNNGALSFSTAAGQTATLLKNSSLNIPAGVAVTWNQAISGSHALTKSGAGTITTGNSHTYTGGFTLAGGTLEITTSGDVVDGVLTNSAVGLGILTLRDGQIQSTTSTARTIYTSVDFDGTVAITSNWVDPLDATNVRTGNFIISPAGGGVTRLISDSTLNVAQTVNWNQAISGSGSLTKIGAGTLRLNGINTYTGGTIVSEGILRGDAESIQGNVVNNAEIVFNETTGGTYAGVISGSGSVSKIGSATLTVSGVNTFVGGTTVSAGTLHLTGQLSSPVIVDGGTLSGSGRISSTATVGAAGRLAFTLPTSPAALTPLLVDDAVTFVEGATLEITGTDLTVGTVWTLVTANSFTGPLPQLALPTDWQGALAVVGQDLRFTLQSLGATRFEAWRELHFGSTAVTTLSAANADPDGDGWTNLVEYALGLNPLASDGAAAIEHGTDNGRLKLTFNRLAEPDLTYVVEATDTLGTTWTAIWTSSGAQNTAGPVTVTDTVLLSSQPARFLRLRVETPTW